MGENISLTVQAVDQFGNAVTDFTGAVTFSGTGVTGLPASYTFTTGAGMDNGTHTFTNLSIGTAGSSLITITSGAGATTATSAVSLTVGGSTGGSLPPPTPGLSGVALQVNNLYRALFGRNADQAGLDYWVGRVNGGAGWQEVVREITGSLEYRLTVVREVYQELLGREPDAAGLDHWAGWLGQNNRTREDLVVQIFSSMEYYLGAGGTDQGFVRALYNDILGRPADQAGLDHWVSILASDSTSINVRTQVVRQFLNSAEYTRTQVVQIYETLLGRAPDAAGLDYWANRLQGAATYEDLLVSIASSPEFLNRTV